jgi:arylsulfatase A-like enzyme
LFATCSLNRDFLQPYDASVTTTPHLAELARESIVFEQHVTEAGVSGIAYASLFTGSQADTHGIYHHPSRLDGKLLTIFEAFGAAGYETHYFNGHKMASAELDYAQGVRPEHVYPSQQKKRRILSAEDADFARLLARLAAEPELSALVVANFTVTHAAYTAQLEPAEFAGFLARNPELAGDITPADFRRLGQIYEEHRLPLQWDYANTVRRIGLSESDQERMARLLELVYRADVEILDGIVGAARAALRTSGLDGETLFAFTADHGEYLFHAQRLFQWGHGLQLAPEELAVPWILKPAHNALSPGRYAGTTRSMDVFPTLAGLCGVPLPAGSSVRGENLASALRGERPPPGLDGLAHTKVLDQRLMDEFADLALVRSYYPSMSPELMWTSLRRGTRYLRLANRGDGVFEAAAYDLAADPLALVPLALTPVERADLERYKERLIEHYDDERGVDEATIEDDLRDLGYVR